jgi:hypothetical protein
MTRWLRLGVRLSLGRGVGRAVLMSTGAAVGTLVLLASLAAMTVIDRQGDTAAARSPIYANSAPPESETAPPERAPRRGRVSELTFGGDDDAIGERPVHRVAVAGANAASPKPPGVEAYPGAGEAVVSPALAALIRTDERAQARFPQRIVGLIGEAGLIAPDELYAFVGVPPDDPYLVDHAPVVGFGRTHASVGQLVDWFTQERGVAITFIVLVLVPFGIFLATCARLSASTRDRRIAALRLLGVSTRQAALVNAVETGVVAGAGTLIGYALFRALAPISQSWRLGRLHWYARDLVLPVAVLGFVLLATALFAVTVGVLATRPARTSPLRLRRDAPARRPALWRAAVLIAGLGLLLVALRDTPQDTPTIFVSYGFGILLVGLGLPLMVPLLSWTVAGIMRRLPVPLSWQLAAARLRHSPGVAPRLAAALTAVLFVTGVASLGLTVVVPRLDANTKADANTTAATARGNTNTAKDHTPTLAWTTIATPELAEEITALGGRVARRDSLIGEVDGTPSVITVADCASLLAEFSLPADESCVDGNGYRIATGDDRTVAAGARVRVHHDDWSFAAPRQVLHPIAREESTIGAILLTPSAPQLDGQALEPATYATIYLPDAGSLENLAQLISAQTPANAMQSRLRGAHGVDAPLLDAVLTTFLLVATGLGVAAFAVAAADRVVERRGENAALSVVGTPNRIIAASELVGSVLPLALGVALATASTIAVALTVAALVGQPVTAAMGVIGPTSLRRP